jgi:hypothetical protein
VDSQIIGALIILGLLVIGSIGTIVKAITDKIVADLAINTTLTREAKNAANGQLTGVIDQLAAERNIVQGLRAVVRERDDRIAYIVARLPEAQGLMRDYSDRRTARASDADVIAAEQHLLGSD